MDDSITLQVATLDVRAVAAGPEKVRSHDDSQVARRHLVDLRPLDQLRQELHQESTISPKQEKFARTAQADLGFTKIPIQYRRSKTTLHHCGMGISTASCLIMAIMEYTLV